MEEKGESATVDTIMQEDDQSTLKATRPVECETQYGIQCLKAPDAGK